mgnify:CR=1 FL=1
MRFYTDFNSFEFDNPAQYPAVRPVRLQQIQERSAAGTIHVETYAEALSTRTLNFREMNENDYTGLLDWFINKVNGMANEFKFEDERNATYTVRFATPVLDLRETSFKQLS